MAASTVFHFVWTDEALGILAALREVIVQRTEEAAQKGASSHAQMGHLAVLTIERLTRERPEGIVLTNMLAASMILYLDSVVAGLREMGIFSASEVMRRMGWRTRRPGGSAVSPDAHDRSKRAPAVESRARTGPAPEIRTPPRKAQTPEYRAPVRSPSSRTTFYSPSR